MSNRNDITGDKIITKVTDLNDDELQQKWDQAFGKKKVKAPRVEKVIYEPIEEKPKKVIKGINGNTSGIIPVGHRLLIKPLVFEEVTASGVIIATATQADRERLAQIKGTVIAMGTTAFGDQLEPWCKVGDVITFGKYSGLIYKGNETLDGEEYRVINDLDVVATHFEE